MQKNSILEPSSAHQGASNSLLLSLFRRALAAKLSRKLTDVEGLRAARLWVSLGAVALKPTGRAHLPGVALTLAQLALKKSWESGTFASSRVQHAPMMLRLHN